MSYSVYVHTDNVTHDYPLLKTEFEKIHEMKIGKEEWLHTINKVTGTKKIPTFLEIPCHWNHKHLIQTEKDIQQVAQKLNIKITTELSY